jgi:hypothetical protein
VERRGEALPLPFFVLPAMTFPESPLRPPECFAAILAAAPGFPPRWLAHLNGCPQDPDDLQRGMALIGNYMHDLVLAGDAQELTAIYAAVEQLLTTCDSDVHTAVATGLYGTLNNLSTLVEIKT